MTAKNNFNKSDGYYLVTTANENSWDASKKVLFLGEWCCKYSKENEMSDLHYSIAAPFCSDSNENKDSIDFIVKKTNYMLNYARDILNKYHGTIHGNRYWNIVLGHWLRRYVTVIYNRYFTLQNAFQNYDIKETASISHTNYSLITQDSLEFLVKVDNDEWNMVLYNMLLSLIQPLSILYSSKIRLDVKYIEYKREKKKHGVKWFVKYLIHSITKLFSRDTDSLIIDTYIGRINEALLKLRLFEAPSFEMGDYGNHISFSIDENFRNTSTPKIDSTSEFDDVLKFMFMKLLPACFLEGYEHYLRLADNSGWPKNPKFIFTSNAFDTNEVFKLYTATHSKLGVPYFVGQHGNAYGTHLSSNNWPELDEADKFFSWGWGDDNNNIVPAFALNRYISGKKIKRVKNGMLLLVENALPPLYEPHDTTFEYGCYQLEQFRLAKTLRSDIRDQLLVRLFAHHFRTSWFYELRWKDELPDIRLENGRTPFMSLVKKCRLVIFSFDTTGVLELLANNFPIICFWRGGHSHIHDNETYYYELLMEVGVFHDNPESAAKKVNEVWDDIDGWWKQDKVQDARKQFCDRYARVSQNPVRELKQILLR